MSHCGLANLHSKKRYRKAKEELWKLKYFTIQKYNLQKKSSNRRNQNPSRYYNSITTNLKFQHKSKYHVSKIIITKIGLLTKIGPKSIKLLYSRMKSKHNILALVGKAKQSITPNNNRPG